MQRENPLHVRRLTVTGGRCWEFIAAKNKGASVLYVDLYIFYTMKTNTSKCELALTPWVMWCLFCHHPSFGHRARRPALKINSPGGEVLAADFACNCQTGFHRFLFSSFQLSLILSLCLLCSGSTKPFLKLKGELTADMKAPYVFFFFFFKFISSVGYFQRIRKMAAFPQLIFGSLL